VLVANHTRNSEGAKLLEDLVEFLLLYLRGQEIDDELLLAGIELKGFLVEWLPASSA
jgi:hypothetical protein